MNTHGYVMLPMVKHIRLSVHQHRVNYIGVNQGVVATSRVQVMLTPLFSHCLSLPLFNPLKHYLTT